MSDLQTMPLNATMPPLLAGDTFLSRSESWLGRSIRWWQGTADGQRSDTNHIGGIVASGGLDTAWASEAVGHVRNIQFGREYANVPIRVYRHRHWDMITRAKVARQWESAEGTGYAWLRMVPIMADSIGAWVKRNIFRRGDGSDFYWFSNRLKVTNFRVCSNHWAWGIEKATGKTPTGRPWQSETPDSAENYMRAHSEEWECIWDSVTPPPPAEIARRVAAVASL